MTVANVRCCTEVRRMLLNQAPFLMKRPSRLPKFDQCIVLVQLTGPYSDLSAEESANCLRLATAHDRWLEPDPDGGIMRRMRRKFPCLSFTPFQMKPAADVFKEETWRSTLAHSFHRTRLITIPQEKHTDLVRSGMSQCKIDPEDGYCFLGPEIQDISNEALLEAAANGEDSTLKGWLHPAVADMLMQLNGHALSVVPETKKNDESGGCSIN